MNIQNIGFYFNKLSIIVLKSELKNVGRWKMQTLKIEVEDNLLEKILLILNSFSGVKVKEIDNSFLDDIKNSEDDILNNRVTKIDDIDNYIKELKNAVI